MEKENRPPLDSNQDPGFTQQAATANNNINNMPQPATRGQNYTGNQSQHQQAALSPSLTTAGYGYPIDQRSQTGFAPPPLAEQKGNSFFGDHGTGYGYPTTSGGGAAFPGVSGATPIPIRDPTVPRPNDILPLHPAITQQRQIAASLPPCPKGGYHELRTHHALGMNLGTVMSLICFPIVCCCVRDETVCIKCHQKFNFALPAIQ